jgi:HK97 family phage prohead protease
MQHLKLKAVDREGDVVVASAMVKALRAWMSTGKLVPLAWNHSTAAEDQVGHIDPATVVEVNAEVVAGGKVDLDTERGRHTWRLMKSGTLGFSFGYMVIDAVKRSDGKREIRALDVFEVSATTVPMNAGTRVLATKAADDVSDPPSHAELECELIRAGIITRPANHADYQRLDPAVTGTGPNGHERYKSSREHERRRMLRLLDDEWDSKAAHVRHLKQAHVPAAAKSQQPVRIATFEC